MLDITDAAAILLRDAPRHHYAFDALHAAIIIDDYFSRRAVTPSLMLLLPRYAAFDCRYTTHTTTPRGADLSLRRLPCH